jgi:hypothetical protein
MGEDTPRAHCQTPLPQLFQICHLFDKPLSCLFTHQSTSIWTLYTSASSFIESLCSSASPVIAMHTGALLPGKLFTSPTAPSIISIQNVGSTGEHGMRMSSSYGSLVTTALRFGIAADPLGGLHYTCTSGKSARIASILTHEPRREPRPLLNSIASVGLRTTCLVRWHPAGSHAELIAIETHSLSIAAESTTLHEESTYEAGVQSHHSLEMYHSIFADNCQAKCYMAAYPVDHQVLCKLGWSHSHADSRLEPHSPRRSHTISKPRPWYEKG